MELLKILYDTKEPLPDAEGIYHQALQQIEEDGISSQVYFLLKQQGRLEQTPSFFQERLKDEYNKCLFQNLFIKNQTEQLLKKCEEQRIDVIPLKGVYFAEKYFGHIGARATSDIDLLIRSSDLEKAIESVKSLGFTVEEEQVPGHFHCSFSKKLPNSDMPLVVELHWSLVKESTSSFDISDFWKQSKTVGPYVHVEELSPNHTFYMICLHGWRHNLDSNKYYLDIIQMIYRLGQELDYEYLYNLSAKHQTLKRIIRTLSIVYLQFPLLNDVKPLPFLNHKKPWKNRKAKRIKQYIDFLDYQFFSYDSFKHTLIEVGNWICPNRYELKAQLEEVRAEDSYFKMFLSLYKKRITSMLRVVKAT